MRKGGAVVPFIVRDKMQMFAYDENGEE